MTYHSTLTSHAMADAVDAERDAHDADAPPLQRALRGRLTAQTFLGFVLAGRAVFTLRSGRTNVRYTFKVVRAPGSAASRPWFVRTLTGPDNTANYTYIGAVWSTDAGTFRLKQKTNSAAWRALEWVFTAAGVGKLDVVFAQLEAWHEGHCGRCGRALTVPESIESGIGPVCQGYQRGER